jgi:hypothetical protein
MSFALQVSGVIDTYMVEAKEEVTTHIQTDTYTDTDIATHTHT